MLKKILVMSVLAFASNAQAMHEQWDSLLNKHIKEINNGASTAVDYKGFANDKAELNSYIDSLAAVSQEQYQAWNKDKQLAFLINSYNANTVSFILTKYPDLDSIKDLGNVFSSPWSKDVVSLLGEKRSLDDVEHGLIREAGVFDEPRIHFAVNCASIGCPALRNEAYNEQELSAQLEEQTHSFLSDSSRNYLDGNTLHLSSIFKWYGKDFADKSGSLQVFLADYAKDLGADSAALNEQKYKIKYLDYDWGLNDVK
ncbi:DUF547 domain-containing protein [Vibrio sp. RC27]